MATKKDTRAVKLGCPFFVVRKWAARRAIALRSRLPARSALNAPHWGAASRAPCSLVFYLRFAQFLRSRDAVSRSAAFEKAGETFVLIASYSAFSKASMTIFNALMRAYFLSTDSRMCQGA